jgi:transposase
MPRSHPPYPPEFRAEAIELIRSGAKRFSELARDLGVTDQTLRNWVRQADLDNGRRRDGLTTAEREELTRLRRENRVLRQERDILRKAAAYFARETDSIR